MPMAPFTDDERKLVRELHAEGCGRNEISRRTGTHPRRVSAIAAELGLTFRRSAHTAEATTAKREDGRARRAALALRLIEDAERLRQQLWQPAEYVDHGGKDFAEARWTRDQPTFSDQRNIMQAIGVAVDRSVRLDEYDSGAGLGQVVSLLDQLGKGLLGKYGTGDGEHPVDPAPADG